MKKFPSRRQISGLSLVEVMVSMVIGIVVVAAVLVSYVSSGKTSKQQAAFAEMHENAQMALTLVSRDLMLAGYAQVSGVSAPVAPATTTTFTRTFSGNAVFGCDNGFVTANTTGVVACASTSGAPSIEISYEADTANTVPVSGSPSDCKGAQLRPVAGVLSGVNFFVTRNRYYLGTGSTGRSELYCASGTQDASGGAVGAEPLVDNVEAMKIWYGVAAAANPRQVVRYVTAGNVGVGEWPRVVSVRICLLMRSTDPVIDMELYPDASKPPKYLDCDSIAQSITDRYLRSAYFSTTTLRNKMAL